jgi:hypothetical protein
MSLVRSLRRLFGPRGPCARVVNRKSIVFMENGRKMTIAGEMLSTGFELYVASIVNWDDSTGELVTEPERARVLQEVKRSLEGQGMTVVLN